MISKTESITKELKKSGIQILNEILVLPLTYESTYPLKKEFWEGSKIEYDEWSRWELMLRASQYYKLYKLIVTSSFHEGKADILTAAFPFRDGLIDEVEIFMKASDFPVSETSKNAAIYSIEEPIGFDTFTKQIIKPGHEDKHLAIN
jgi:hypothetical protein